MHLKIQTKDLALISIYAALYAGLVVGLGFISYGPITPNCRRHGCLSSLDGYTRRSGAYPWRIHRQHILARRLIDLLNTIPSFAMSFVVYYVYKQTKNDYTVIGTCVAYSAVLGTTVGWMLSYPLWAAAATHHRCM